MVQISPSCVFTSLEKCIDQVIKEDFNYQKWAVIQEIVTVNQKWKYVFVAHHPLAVELFRLESDEKLDNVFLNGYAIAQFHMRHMGQEFVAGVVARIIEEVEAH